MTTVTNQPAGHFPPLVYPPEKTFQVEADIGDRHESFTVKACGSFVAWRTALNRLFGDSRDDQCPSMLLSVKVVKP